MLTPRARAVRLRALVPPAVAALLLGTMLTGCDEASPAKAARLVLEAVGASGPHPFLSNPDSDLKGVRSAPAAASTAGDARGAFGGTRSTTQCDKALLIRELTKDPAEAAAWAKVRGVQVPRIADHINALTSVVLLHDTLVKNHNYQGEGRTSEYLSVLQTGMAVLVDAYGRPAVKCNCGNPLLEPDSDVDVGASQYVGARWDGFSAADVTVITPRPQEKGPMRQIPLVDPYERDTAFDRGTGTDGGQDSRAFHWNPPSPGTPKRSAGPGEEASSAPGGPAGSPAPPGSSGPPDAPAAPERSGSAGPPGAGGSSGRGEASGPAGSSGAGGSSGRGESSGPAGPSGAGGSSGRGEPSGRGEASGPAESSGPAGPSRPAGPSAPPKAPAGSVKPHPPATAGADDEPGRTPSRHAPYAPTGPVPSSAPSRAHPTRPPATGGPAPVPTDAAPRPPARTAAPERSADAVPRHSEPAAGKPSSEPAPHPPAGAGTHHEPRGPAHPTAPAAP
ncbi:DUF6777 domain-containing protein [Streptomyces gamaensis]|uniref:DUF6777 domain-containing protein n=1 Tax=Streptomyces gamaensis TaxID=1763542 RepID=A0ABW0Z3H8_9ACTN